MVVGILAVLLLAAPAVAHPPSISTKQAEAQRVIGELQQLDSSLGQANERLNLANVKLAYVREQIKENRRELHIAQHNLRRSHATIAQRLVTLYTNGETSTLEVILGARNLSEVLNRIDSQNRISTLDETVIRQVKTYKRAVKRHARELRRDRAQAKRLVAWRAAQQRTLQARIVQRVQLLASLNAEIQRMIAIEQARQLAAARAQWLAAQARQAQSAGSAPGVLGVTAQTPEGATVVPQSNYTGAVGEAMSQLGTPYVWGGAGPGGFDCSGLVTYAFGKMGVSLPHSSYALWNEGVSVPSDQLQAGDLVFFNSLGHMGIYIGSGQYVHAPQTGDVVKVSSVSSHGGYVGARRIVSR